MAVKKLEINYTDNSYFTVSQNGDNVYISKLINREEDNHEIHDYYTIKVDYIKDLSNALLAIVELNEKYKQ